MMKKPIYQQYTNIKINVKILFIIYVKKEINAMAMER